MQLLLYAVSTWSECVAEAGFQWPAAAAWTSSYATSAFDESGRIPQNPFDTRLALLPHSPPQWQQEALGGTDGVGSDGRHGDAVFP